MASWPLRQKKMKGGIKAEICIKVFFKIFISSGALCTECNLRLQTFCLSGKQTFEKMISGMYMGELTRQVQLYCYRVYQQL